jgi:hypothetical protein
MTTPKPPAPREWWINVDTHCPEYEIFEEKPDRYPWRGELTHVIEKSHLDSANKRIEELEAAGEVNLLNQDDFWMKENSKLQAHITELEKQIEGLRGK